MERMMSGIKDVIRQIFPHRDMDMNKWTAQQIAKKVRMTYELRRDIPNGTLVTEMFQVLRPQLLGLVVGDLDRARGDAFLA